MANIVRGYRKWECDRDDEGHRTYKVVVLVQMDSVLDGPASALQTPGLPVYGAYWLLGNDVDVYAYCKQGTRVTPVVQEGDPNQFFHLEYTFTTKADNKSCKEHQIDDPLLQPIRISGDFSKYQEEATHDRFGNPIVNSAWEPLRGQQVEFDAHRSTVKIEQNVADLQYELCRALVDCLNDAPLWGLPERCWKVSKFDWEKKYQGQCNPYYVRKFEFESSVRMYLNPTVIVANLTAPLVSGWDKDLLDAGHKMINGHWVTDALGISWHKDALGTAAAPNPDPQNPSHFIHAKDSNGENIEVILDGQGSPITTTSMVFDTLTGTISAIEYNAAMPTGQIRCTCTNHGLKTGDLVYISGATGTTSMNGIFGVQVGVFGGIPSLGLPSYSDANHFYLKGVDPNAALTNAPTWKRTLRKSSVAGNVHVEKYQQANLLLLGIPTTF